MGGLYSPFKVYTPGEVLTAADLNATDQNHITNQTPQMTDDYSADLTQARLQSDPTSGLATSLAIEIQQLRHVIARLGGKTFWNEVTGPITTTGPTGGLGVRTKTSQLRGVAWGSLSTIQLDATSVAFSAGSAKDNVSATLNLTTAGPALNGRDIPGNFQNEWVNVWYIYNPTTAVCGLTATRVANVITPPALPTGFTEYCYATSLRVGAVPNQWLAGGRGAHVTGSWVTYHPNVQLIWRGIQKSEQSVDISAWVPTDRIYGCMYRLFVDPQPGGGSSLGHVAIRVHSNVNMVVYRVEHPYIGEQETSTGHSELTVPVWAPNFFYFISIIDGDIFVEILLNAYQCPNGDS